MNFIKIGRTWVNLDLIGLAVGVETRTIALSGQAAREVAAYLDRLAPSTPAPPPDAFLIRKGASMFGIIASRPDAAAEEVAALSSIRSELVSWLGSPRKVCMRSYSDRVRELLRVQEQLERARAAL